MSELYKGCWVDPRAYELSNGSGWDAEVYVAEDVGPETIDTRYSLTGTFLTREAAIEAALNVGKRKVDEITDSVDSELEDLFKRRQG